MIPTERREPPKEKLNGKVALVTGASLGIGAAIAEALARHGAKVGCMARKRAPLDTVVSRIIDSGGVGSAHPGDVTKYADVVHAIENIEEFHGPIEIAFLNAGANLNQSPISDADPESWQAVIDLNLTSVFYGIRSVVSSMRRAGGGRIVFTGSAMAQYPQAENSAYCAAKAGARLIMRTAAIELASEGITINELIPGPTRTSQALASGQGDDPDSPFNNPAEWVKTPKDIVPLALMLATFPGKGPTGQTFSLARR